MEALAIMIWITALIIKILVDESKIKEDITIHHGEEAIVLLAAYLEVASVFSVNWYHFVALLLSVAILSWIIIDVVLNRIRNKKLDYYGTEAVLDKLLGGLKVKQVITFKFLLLSISIVVVKLIENNL